MTANAATNTAQSTPKTARSKPASLVWDDTFLIENQLVEEERMIRDSASSYCQEALETRVLMANRNEVVDREIMTEMGEMGLLGVTILTNMVASEQTTFPTGWSRVKWSGWSNPYFSAFKYLHIRRCDIVTALNKASVRNDV